jgi:hypothetical protein
MPATKGPLSPLRFAMKTPPRLLESRVLRWLVSALAVASLLSGCVEPSSPDGQTPDATEGTVSLHISGD